MASLQIKTWYLQQKASLLLSNNEAFFMLFYLDSNQDKQDQNLLCYHYTIGQAIALSVKKRCKDNAMQAIFQIFLDFFV